MIHQLHIIRQVLKRQGMDCFFSESKKNEFGEGSVKEETMACKGLFHESNKFLDISLADAGKITAKKKPKVLILYSAIVKEGYAVKINGTDYIVIGIDDLGNQHVCLDLSLEVI